MKGIFRLLPLFLGAILALMLYLFCERNSAPVNLKWFSFSDEETLWTMPAYQLLFGSFLCGVLLAGLGFLSRWLETRLQIRSLIKEVRRLRAKYEPNVTPTDSGNSDRK